MKYLLLKLKIYLRKDTIYIHYLQVIKHYQQMELDMLNSKIKELEFQHYLQTGRFPD